MACIRFSRESAQHRKDLICWLGQPVRITVETLPGQDGGLVVLALTPLEGFIHLVADPADCIKQYGPYHVSLCQKALVSQSDLDELRGMAKKSRFPSPVFAGKAAWSWMLAR